MAALAVIGIHRLTVVLLSVIASVRPNPQLLSLCTCPDAVLYTGQVDTSWPLICTGSVVSQVMLEHGLNQGYVSTEKVKQHVAVPQCFRPWDSLPSW